MSNGTGFSTHIEPPHHDEFHPDSAKFRWPPDMSGMIETSTEGKMWNEIVGTCLNRDTPEKRGTAQHWLDFMEEFEEANMLEPGVERLSGHEGEAVAAEVPVLPEAVEEGVAQLLPVDHHGVMMVVEEIIEGDSNDDASPTSENHSTISLTPSRNLATTVQQWISASAILVGAGAQQRRWYIFTSR